MRQARTFARAVVAEPKRGRTVTPRFDEAEALRLLEAGMTDRAIQRALGVPHVQNIGNWRRRRGLARNAERRGKWDFTDEQIIVTMMTVRTIGEAAARLGCSESTAYVHFNRLRTLIGAFQCECGKPKLHNGRCVLPEDERRERRAETDRRRWIKRSAKAASQRGREIHVTRLEQDELRRRIIAALPAWLHRDVREDVIGECYAAILEGTITLDGIRKAAGRFASAATSAYSTSLDRPLSDDGATSFLDMLADPDALDEFDAALARGLTARGVEMVDD